MEEIEKFELYDGKVILEYRDDKHLYTVDKKVVYSVTGITSILSKPALVNWAVKLTKDKLKELQEELGWKEFAETFPEMLLTAGREHYVASKVATSLGTRVHDMAERWLTKNSDHTKLMQEMLKTESEEERLSYTALLQFFNEHAFKPTSLERKCFSIKDQYAGTVDYYGEIDGKLTVMDYKTSKAVYEGYPLQATAYASALVEEGYKVDQTMITRVGKDGILEVKTEKSWKKNLPAFISAKNLYEYRMALKGRKYKKIIKK